jgi:hypothetical protein
VTLNVKSPWSKETTVDSRLSIDIRRYPSVVLLPGLSLAPMLMILSK